MDRDEIVISYYRVRQALGWLGLSLPVLLIAGGVLSVGGVEPSISDYYHTVLRDVFVGVMTSIAIFLIAYPGHRSGVGEFISDDKMTTLAGLAAFGVAFLPNEKAGVFETESVSQLMMGVRAAAIGHYTCALIFLSALTWICLRKFTRTAKPWRRRIYRACGWTIAAMTVGVLVTSAVRVGGVAPFDRVVEDWMLILWCEAIAVWAFSLAWLTKGRADQSLARMLHLTTRRDSGIAAGE
ncbi:hypothetical protein [Wenxinia marina]|uniref:DUF998 domain-containing protein n=1 Tax=Wenxinia marina DSM 24838 TaxID=1123501 RepID=A0A0D0QD45_9RHOB|nr:hypothetical protein [Wenxinia marina]KIQ68933.1 hypothetical protein Wenmar_02665 [Wenxinia marina DSM 24838]GGL64000.1 hypothetical protein GCM10011392_18370 [Wenxinia marina]